jgi:hypothetical protein
MAQADSNNSTRAPIDSTRRGFLSQAAGLAGGTALALAIPTPPAAAVSDPVFDLIEAHRKIDATVNAVVAEINRSAEIEKTIALEQGALSEHGSVEMDLFLELLEVVPTTLAGVVALVAYLDQVSKKDPWKFEDTCATPLIGTLATAFNRMAATCA